MSRVLKEVGHDGIQGLLLLEGLCPQLPVGLIELGLSRMFCVSGRKVVMEAVRVKRSLLSKSLV